MLPPVCSAASSRWPRCHVRTCRSTTVLGPVFGQAIRALKQLQVVLTAFRNQRKCICMFIAMICKIFLHMPCSLMSLGFCHALCERTSSRQNLTPQVGSLGPFWYRHYCHRYLYQRQPDHSIHAPCGMPHAAAEPCGLLNSSELVHG